MSIIDEHVEGHDLRSDTTELLTINQRIATALGDRTGSYENLIGLRICAALGIDPSAATLVSTDKPSSSETAASSHTPTADASAPAEHASDLLDVLTTSGHN